MKEKLIAKLNDHISANMTLKGFVCICSSCKDIRNKEGVWTNLEEYFGDTIDLQFTHCLCPKCARKHYPGFADKTKLN